MVPYNVYNIISQNKMLCQFRVMIETRKENGCWHFGWSDRVGHIGVLTPDGIAADHCRRFSYMAFYERPYDKRVTMACKNGLCVNPAHMRWPVVPSVILTALRGLAKNAHRVRAAARKNLACSRRVVASGDLRLLRLWRNKPRPPGWKSVRRRRERLKALINPRNRITERVRAGVRTGLKRRGLWKMGKTFDALGYTPEMLMKHLERQFHSGMSWNNFGRWHIDHIIPLASFQFTGLDDPEFRAAWALSNLRPLWGADNIRKGTRRTLLL